MDSQLPVWFVTGCSSGIGRALAEALASHGVRAAVTARDAASLADLERRAPGRIKALPLDVTDESSVRRAVDAALAAFGRIDVLVNNAGVGQKGAIEEISDAEVRRVYYTNVLGTLNVLRAVLPAMRARRSGRIFNLSSKGGLYARAGIGMYNSSKFALEGISEALAQEVAPLGISVTIVAAGVFKTDFRTRSLQAPSREIPEYAGTAGRMRANVADYAPEAVEPVHVARALIALAEASGKPPVHLVFGTDAVELVREKLALLTAEVDRWEALSRLPGNADASLEDYRAAVEAAAR